MPLNLAGVLHEKSTYTARHYNVRRFVKLHLYRHHTACDGNPERQEGTSSL